MPNAQRFSPLVRWLLIAAAVLCVLSLAKDFVLKIAIEKVGSSVVGARLQVGHLALGLLSQKIVLKNIRIDNPPGFPDGVMLLAPQVRVDVDVPAAIQGRLHFPLIVFHLEQLVAVKNKQGKLNIEELKIVQEKMNEKNKGPAPNFQVDVLKLTIGQVVVEDHTKGPRPLVQAYDVRLKEKTLKNIHGVQQLAAAVMVEALKPTALRSAGLFAAGTLLGVGFLPGLALGVVVADDHASAQFSQGADKVYAEALVLSKELGTVKKENKAGGQLIAKIYGCDVVFDIQGAGWGKSSVKIKARKYMLAKPAIAAGIMHQLKERLKQENS